MPLSWGGALSYSPLLYRPRERWSEIAALLRGNVPQPSAAHEETSERLAGYEREVDDLFAQLRASLLGAKLDALVVLTADRCRAFDDANFPQLHVHAGMTIWSDTALPQVGEGAVRASQACDPELADELIAELFDAGFEVAESHGEFVPYGDPARGAMPALLAPLARLDCGLPIVPVHLNCHVQPALRGTRCAQFGHALGEALAHSDKRVGILASGGLSGDPGGYLAGWIDPELDRWVLRQLETSRSHKLASMFDIDSQAMRGSSAELRLWLAAGAAMESVEARPRRLGYVPLHAAAAGIGFFAWEVQQCQ